MRQTGRQLDPIPITLLFSEERERGIQYVHSASLGHEDGIVFLSEPSAARQWDNG